MKVDINLKIVAWKLMIAAGFMLVFPVTATSQTSYAASNNRTASSQPLLQAERGAGTNTARSFSGTWRLASDETKPSRRLNSIENAIAGLGRIQQERAREMLTQKTAPPVELKIVDSGSEIRMSRTGHEFTVPTNGQAVTINSTEGRVTMRAARRDRSLVLESKTKNTSNTITYVLSPDGKQLTEQVQLQASALSKTIQFSSSYSNQNQAQANSADARLATERGQPNSSSQNLSGTWRLVNDATQSSQRLNSIENAIAGFGRFQQGRAREMLTQKTAPPAELTIVDSGTAVKISRAGQEFTVRTDGQAVTINSPEGRVTLRAGRQNGNLVVESKSSGATNTATFKLSSDGRTLTQQVQLQASKLSETIQFSSSFVR